MGDDERDLRNAVKNAKSAFYTYKGKKRKQTRKEIRRADRVLKKTNQHHFQLKKYNLENSNDTPPETQIPKKKKRRRKKKKRVEANDESLCYDKASYDAANKIDEKLISSLGKKLCGNKKKDHLPSIFKEDGLDYILEVCEPFTADSKGFSSDEEYLASKSKKIKKVEGKADAAEMSAKYISNKLLFEDGNEIDDDNDDEKVEEEMEGEEVDEEDLNEEIIVQSEESDEENISENEVGNCESDDHLDDEEEEEENDGDIVENAKNLDGNHTKENSSKSHKYIPPALRLVHMDNTEKQNINETRIKKKLKGLLNRVSDGTLLSIVNEIEMMYFDNSTNLMNEILYEMISEACISTIITPEKLVIQNMIIVAALQLLTGSEVASYFLQMLAKKFSKLHDESPLYGEGKTCDNVLLMLISLYNLKVVDCILVYGLIRTCLNKFTEQDIGLIFLVLKSCGPDIRKDDPGALKDIIVEVQSKSTENFSKDKSYVNFMLEAINALKNNNIRKIPLYDGTVVEEARKCLKTVIQGKSKTSEVQLKVSLNDLLDADEKGRWWITGSAWSGRGPVEDNNLATRNIPNSMDFSVMILKAAKKQKMNTNIRKQIFCVMVSSEDYIDAFEKLLKLNLKEKQAREIIHVLMDCCLHEKSYNMFYPHLANKLCEFNKSNQVTLQYSLWDRFKTIPTMKKYNISNLGQFLAHMIASKSLSLSVLKVVSFGALDKVSIDFFSNFFTTFLLQYPRNIIKLAFQRISNVPKLTLLRQGIKLFLRHFLYPDENKQDNEIDISNEKMKELIEIVESALDGYDYVPL